MNRNLLLCVLISISSFTFAGGTGGFDGGGNSRWGTYTPPTWGNGTIYFQEESRWVNAYHTKSMCLNGNDEYQYEETGCYLNPSRRGCSVMSESWVYQARESLVERCDLRDGEGELLDLWKCPDRHRYYRPFVQPRHHIYEIYDHTEDKYTSEERFTIPDCR